MKKKCLIITLIAIMIMTAGVLAACDNSTGKGHDEIISVANYENYYIAKSKDGYNVFNAKGKAVLANDYDEVQVQSSAIIIAKDIADASETYFKMDGSAYNFAVQGLMISRVEVYSDTFSATNGNDIMTHNMTPKAIKVSYLDKATNIYYTSVYKYDGTLAVTNTNKIIAASNETNLTSNISLTMKSTTTYDSNGYKVVENKLSNIYKQESFAVEFDEETNMPLKYNSVLEIYDGAFKQLFSKSVDYIQYNSNTYFTLYSSVENNGVTTSECIIVNRTTGTQKVFNISNSDRKLYFEEDFVLCQPVYSVTGNALFEMYKPSTNVSFEKTGTYIELRNNIIGIETSSNNGDRSSRTLIDKTTLQVVKSDIIDIFFSGSYLVIDGILYNDNYEALVSAKYAENVVRYDVVNIDAFPDVYYFAYFDDGSYDYCKNSTVLKSFSKKETVVNRNDGLIKVKNAETNVITYYNQINPSIEYSNYSALSMSSVFAPIFEGTVGIDEDGNYIRADLNIFGNVISHKLPSGASDFRASARFEIDKVIVMNISYKKSGSSKYTNEFYVYHFDSSFFSTRNRNRAIGFVKIYETINESNGGVTVKFNNDKIIINDSVIESSPQGSATRNKTIIFEESTINNGEKFIAKQISSVEIGGLNLVGKYLLQNNTTIGSSFSNVYTLSGKKIVNSEFRIKSIVGDLAVFTVNNSSYGVIKLSEDGYKILENPIYHEVSLLGGGYYGFVTYDKNLLPQLTLKDVKGKTIVKKAYDLTINRGIENNMTVVDGMTELNITYQTKPGGKYYYKSLGRVLNINE